MKTYLAAFIAAPLTIFCVLWAIILFDYKLIGFPDYWLWKPHAEMLKACDVGDVAILGDSTAMADIIPSRIGPGLRDFGFNGGTPVEAYFIGKSILHCGQKPKAVIIAFTPDELRAVPVLGGSPYFWGAFKYNIVNYADAMQVLRVSRQYGITTITGPKSLFDLDYRIKALLVQIKFPPYFYSDLEEYVSGKLQHDRRTDKKLNATIYAQSVADKGHHFISTHAFGDGVDDDADRSDTSISPVAAYYLQQIVAEFTARGIAVYFVEPPRDSLSAGHYVPELISVYQNALAQLAGKYSNFHVLNGGFNIWATTLFGDNSHLNLRGALALSQMLHDALNSAGGQDIIYPAADLAPNNLYTEQNGDNGIPAGQAPKSHARPNPEVALPELAYPGGSLWLLKSIATGSGAAAIQTPPISLQAKTNYGVAVFVKSINAGSAGLTLNWPGGTIGNVSWDFTQRQINYAGTVNTLNSGVTLCPDGWVELYISGITGTDQQTYAGPKVSVTGSAAASAYIYNISVEKTLWPTNYCKPQPGEVTVTPMPGGN